MDDIVEERHVNQKPVVHDAKERMVLKVGNRRISSDDSKAKGKELSREYQILLDYIGDIDIDLDTTDGLVGLYSLIPRLWLPGNKNRRTTSCRFYHQQR